MDGRVYNFNPGPATLPLDVLRQAQQELLNYKGTGMSVMEMSHRSKDFEAIVHEAEALCKAIAGIGDDYRVLFLQGGASMQFALIPYNFLPVGTHAYYAVTGNFAEKAFAEAQRAGLAKMAVSTAADKHNRIPAQHELNFPPEAAYLHITTNNTVYGTEWHYIPETNGVPLIADMSSNIFSRPLDYGKFALAYAGAQKNLGPAGVTLVIVRKSMLEKVPEDLPNMFSYKVMAKQNSLYNTPPTFGIYMLKLVLEWLKDLGGLPAIARQNREKAGMIYAAIDNSDGFYRGHAQKESRSLMNITFHLPSGELEQKFVAEAAAKGLVGLKGYRTVGGIRASVYNAMPRAGCELLATFMDDFAGKNR
ncbi:MAG TPA: 3-phosphoserine/phosphohydroxythreonine transaminase [Firmicutes bacterium]|nr:3-phosphoserine/phosphohydroxythreonine transaminase [Bacillota bacterium]